METNRFAAMCLSATHTGDSPVPNWETNSDELKAHSVFLILNRLPEIHDYWSTSEIFTIQHHPHNQHGESDHAMWHHGIHSHCLWPTLLPRFLYHHSSHIPFSPSPSYFSPCYVDFQMFANRIHNCKSQSSPHTSEGRSTGEVRNPSQPPALSPFSL